ncbi:coiled-coil domain-containing protein 18 isoform X2 [Trichomycterus rosablanca]|uniref:coiled-coil domain-containing protein 18 isoform X2 n=1 Tax=Trichomycterus rosablanca TaxID=2290929 RepID=UPI002F3609C9
MEAKQALQAQTFSAQELEIKNAQLRRILSTAEQEKASLILENRKLINELETLQLELASSKTKVSVLVSMVGSKTSSMSQMKEELAHLKAELQTMRISHRDVGKKLKETQEVLAMRNKEVKQLKEELDKQTCQSISQLQKDAEHVQDLIAKVNKTDQPEADLKMHLNKVTQLEKQLEDEKGSASRELKKTEQRVLEAKQDVQIHPRHRAKPCSSVTRLQEEMNKYRGELSEKERELLKIRRASGAKASQLAQMEKMLQETKGMLEKKNEMVSELEEKVQRSKRERRNSLHRTQLLESQMKTVRGELVDTLDHLQALRDVLRRSQQKAEERQAAMEKLTSELRETRGQVELLRKEVKDKDEAIKERENRLQQTAQEESMIKLVEERLQEKAQNEESQLQSTVSTLTQELHTLQTQHQAMFCAIQETRAEVLKVSDHVANASHQGHLSEELQCSRAQLEQAYNKSAALLDDLREHEQLLQYTSEALLVKESEITRLKTRLSSIERSTKLQFNTPSSDIRSDLFNVTRTTPEGIKSSVLRVDQYTRPNQYTTP